MNLTSSKIASNIVRYRKVSSVLVCLCVAVLCLNLQNVDFSTNTEHLLGTDDPMLAQKRMVEREFASTYGIQILLSFNDDIFSSKNANAISWLTSEAIKLHRVLKVSSLANYQYIEASEDELIISDLIPLQELYSEEDIERLGNAVKTERKLRGHLINEDADLVPIFVYLNMSNADDSLKEETYQDIKQLLEKFKGKYQSVQIALSGDLALDKAVESVAERDSLVVEMPMLLVILLLVGAFFRSVYAVVSCFLIITLSIMGAIGFAGYQGINLNASNVISLYLILFVSVLDCIHVLSSYRAGCSTSSNRHKVMKDCYEKNILGLFLTTVTTVTSFMAMRFTESAGFQQLGIIASAGIILAFLLSITILPLIMLWGKSDQSNATKTKLLLNIVSPFKNCFEKRRKQTVLTFSLVSVILISFVGENYFDDVAIEMFKPDSPIRKAYESASEELSGQLSFNYVLDSGEQYGIYRADFIEDVDAFVGWLEGQAKIKNVRSHLDVLRTTNQKLNGDNPEFYDLPNGRELLAQLGLMYELSLPLGVDRTDFVSFNKQKLKLEVYTGKLSGNELIELQERIDSYLGEKHGIDKYYNYSYSLMFSYAGQKNLNASILGWVVVLVVLSLCMILLTRSIFLGLALMLPNICPIILTYGVWGLFGGKLTMASISLLIGLGIVIDDTIHFSTQYLRNIRLGFNAERSAINAFDTAGRAIICSSVLLVVGFSIPAIFGEFVFNQISYSLLAIMVFIAASFDLFVLPALLVRLKRG
jgi:uncharacterized protein